MTANLSGLLPHLPNEILRYGLMPEFAKREDFKSLGLLGMTQKAQRSGTIDFISEEGLDLRKMGLDTIQKALDFIINNKLKTANLESFADVTPADLKRIAKEHPAIENILIKTDRIRPDEEIDFLKAFSHLKSFQNCGLIFKNKDQALDYIIKNKLKTVDLTHYYDVSPFQENITHADLLRLAIEHPAIENLFIKTKITLDEELQLIKSFGSLKSFANLQRTFQTLAKVKEYIANFNTCNTASGTLPYLTSINLKTLDLVDSELIDILKLFPRLDSIFIDSASITTLNTHAKKVVCYSSSSLITLIANEATSVHSQCCRSLVSLTANKATTVFCYFCPYLTQLSANNAERVDCCDCKRLPSLSLPKAKEISCRDCKKLVSLVANNAIKIDAKRCIRLTSLEAKNAKEIKLPAGL